jgi:hypothetical protein
MVFTRDTLNAVRLFRAILPVVCLAGPIYAGINWKSVRLEPANIVLASPDATQRYLVIGLNGADLEEDLTATPQCVVTSSHPDVVAVDREHGLLVAKSPGQADIKVVFGETASVSKVRVENRPAEMTIGFSPGIISILTTKGCNGSGCHGSPAGQSGFKLSLFGYDIQADHQMIVTANNGRRVNLQDPEQSLMLRKPSFAVPHGGGRVLPKDSDEYRTILDWLKQGAKLDSSGAQLTRLDLYPAESILQQGRTQRLVAIGRLSDGTTRDMTKEVRYVSGDDALAKVTTDGVITAAARGLTTVMARGMGRVATVQIGVVTTPAWQRPTVSAANFIDELAGDKLYRLQMQSAPLSTDREFIRRVFLDTIGLLPTVDEVSTFIADTRPDKRARLIDRLLERPEYASLWTVKFEDWFRNCQLNNQGRSMGTFKEWTHDWIAQDRPYDQVVRELLTSLGDSTLNPAAAFFQPAADFMLKKVSVNKITPTVTRLFLGVRMECAECHNHPLENFTQDDFYGFSAFFARLNVKHGYGEYRRTWFLEDAGEIEHPVTKKPVRPKFLAGDSPEIPESGDRRTVLADWIVNRANPNFARATVNRIWHEYFEAGIVEPFDDFRSTNMPTNRELLDRLARYFADEGFHFKALHRVILNSRTYQASSRETANGEPAALERQLFARYLPRKLPAEVLLDAITQVTGVSHNFKGYPKGTWAKDIYVPDGPDYFLVTFGLPRRDILADRAKTPTLSQALNLMNGVALREKVQADDNVLGELTGRSLGDTEILANVFERAYARPPSEKESAALADYLANERAAGRDRRRALENVLWSVLNSKEFQLNH